MKLNKTQRFDDMPMWYYFDVKTKLILIRKFLFLPVEFARLEVSRSNDVSLIRNTQL